LVGAFVFVGRRHRLPVVSSAGSATAARRA
jgi:hypothetical protein